MVAVDPGPEWDQNASKLFHFWILCTKQFILCRLPPQSGPDTMTKSEFMGKYIFAELTNQNEDSSDAWYFTETDFETVLNNVEKFGLGIMAMETWLDGESYSVWKVEEYKTDPSDPSWYRNAFRSYKKKGKNLLYSAQYRIPADFMIE
jgi:hypothetical protein